MYQVEAQESLAMLSTAIVEQACYDYIVISEQLTRYTDQGNLKKLNETLTEFYDLLFWFQSEEFRRVSSMNAKKILAGLEEAVEKGVTINVIQGKKRL